MIAEGREYVRNGMRRTLDEYRRMLDPDGRCESYQPIEHPYFVNWKATQQCVDRAEAIERRLSKYGTCLDIGCNIGWFSRRLSRNGWQVCGIDHKELEIEFADSEHLRRFDGPIPPVYVLDDVTRTPLPQVDVALCLSMVMYLFNPIFGTAEDVAWGTMNAISEAAPRMFVDYGGMYSTLDADFPSEIIDRTFYRSFKLLAVTCLDRPLYEFSR